MANIFQEGNGDGSSRRIMAILAPAFLFIIGGMVLVLAAASKIENQWPYLVGLGVIGIGAVYSLILFGFVTSTDLKEIASGITGQGKKE